MCVTGSESLIVIVLSGITESGFKGNWTLYPLHFACRCFDHTLKHSVYHHVRGYFQCCCKFPSSSFVPLRLILGSLTSLFFSPQGRDIPIVRRVIKVKLPHYHLSVTYTVTWWCEVSLILGVAGSHYKVAKGSLHKKWMFWQKVLVLLIWNDT